MFFRRLFRFLGKIIFWFFIITIGVVVLFRFVPVPVTPLMLIRVVEQAREGRPLRLEKDWVAWDEIAPSMARAAVAAEDQRFLEHYGLDFEAIKEAREYNKTHEKKRGASTISQQMAKNVFLWPDRSWLRKGFEVYFTLLTELLWPKQRIMHVYLNVVEFGEGLYGVEAAAQHYFQKPASALNPAQAALLASVLPNPRKWSAASPGPYVRGRQMWVLAQMANIGKLDWEEAEK